MPTPTQTKMTSFFASPSSSKRPLTEPLFNIETPKSMKKRKRPSTLPGQMILDAGQKELGPKCCEECGMVFSVDCSNDINEHEIFHNKLVYEKLFRISFNDLQRFEKVNSGNLWQEDNHILSKRKIAYLSADSKQSSLNKKTMQVIEEIINKEFGFSPDISIWGKKKQCSVLVLLEEDATNWTISTILIREYLKSAQWNDNNEIYNEEKGFILGINRIWTHPEKRKKGNALYLISYDLKTRGKICKNVAFSDPTEDGKRLAKKFSKSSRYLVYSVTK